MTTPFGLFEFLRMPFGLRNAAQTFQCFMDQVLRGLTFAYAYIDNVLIASAMPAEHLEHLRTVFEWLTACGIVINPSKCVFGVKELDFLGQHTDHQGITPLQTKVHTISEFPQPKTQPQMHRFICLVNFYHQYIPHCAEMLHPLHCLLTSEAKSQELSWNEDAINDFQTVKQALAHATLLVYPKSDAPTSVMTAASNTAVGAVLQQYTNGM